MPLVSKGEACNRQGVGSGPAPLAKLGAGGHGAKGLLQGRPPERLDWDWKGAEAREAENAERVREKGPPFGSARRRPCIIAPGGIT